MGALSSLRTPVRRILPSAGENYPRPQNEKRVPKTSRINRLLPYGGEGSENAPPPHSWGSPIEPRQVFYSGTAKEPLSPGSGAVLKDRRGAPDSLARRHQRLLGLRKITRRHNFRARPLCASPR